MPEWSVEVHYRQRFTWQTMSMIQMGQWLFNCRVSWFLPASPHRNLIMVVPQSTDSASITEVCQGTEKKLVFWKGGKDWFITIWNCTSEGSGSSTRPLHCPSMLSHSCCINKLNNSTHAWMWPRAARLFIQSFQQLFANGWLNCTSLFPSVSPLWTAGGDELAFGNSGRSD